MSAAVRGPMRSQEHWGSPSLKEPRYSQSLERGLAILGCFTAERPVMGIAGIAEALGMSRSATHRYAITLVALGYLEQGAGRKYRLGLRVQDIGIAALNATGLREPARPFVEDLRRRSGFSSSLAVLDGPQILYVERARGFRQGQLEIDLNIRVGSRLPAYCTALGRVLLAELGEDEQREVLGEAKLGKRGPNTIVAKRALLAELALVREQGFAVCDQELANGLIAIAAPVRDENGEVVGAINLAAHTSMVPLQGLVDDWLEGLTYMAARLSRYLGFEGTEEEEW